MKDWKIYERVGLYRIGWMFQTEMAICARNGTEAEPNWLREDSRDFPSGAIVEMGDIVQAKNKLRVLLAREEEERKFKADHWKVVE